jgi:hypothetical protein
MNSSTHETQQKGFFFNLQVHQFNHGYIYIPYAQGCKGIYNLKIGDTHTTIRNKATILPCYSI